MKSVKITANDIEIEIKGQSELFFKEDLVLLAIKKLIDSLSFRSYEEMNDFFAKERYLQEIKNYADEILSEDDFK